MFLSQKHVYTLTSILTKTAKSRPLRRLLGKALHKEIKDMIASNLDCILNDQVGSLQSEGGLTFGCSNKENYIPIWLPGNFMERFTATMLSIYGCAISNDLLLQMDDIEMSLLCNLSEQLHWNACSNVNESVEFAQSLNIHKLDRKGPSAWMNVEWNRIRSFDCAKLSAGAEELADIFARSYRRLASCGFFYMKYPTTEGDLAGFCVHFEALVSIPTTDCPSFRNLLSNPLRELEKLMPSSKFLNNFVSSNVTLECTFLSMHPGVHQYLDFDRNPSKISGPLVNLIASSLCPRTPIVATASSDGNVNIWRVDTLILLFTISSLSPTQKSSSACLIEPWLCGECNTENAHSVERCLLCDTPAPGWEAPKIANSNGDEHFDMLLKYLYANNSEAVLSNIFIISNAPYEAESASLHKNRHEQRASGGDGTHQRASNNPANVKGTYIEWCSGWAAPFVEVMIITGMYAGMKWQNCGKS